MVGPLWVFSVPHGIAHQPAAYSEEVQIRGYRDLIGPHEPITRATINLGGRRRVLSQRCEGGLKTGGAPCRGSVTRG